MVSCPICLRTLREPRLSWMQVICACGRLCAMALSASGRRFSFRTSPVLSPGATVLVLDRSGPHVLNDGRPASEEAVRNVVLEAEADSVLEC